MKKFEYFIREVDMETTGIGPTYLNLFVNQLDKLGQAGWELAAIIWVGGSRHLYRFKRDVTHLEE